MQLHGERGLLVSKWRLKVHGDAFLESRISLRAV